MSPAASLLSSRASWLATLWHLHLPPLAAAWYSTCITTVGKKRNWQDWSSCKEQALAYYNLNIFLQIQHVRQIKPLELPVPRLLPLFMFVGNSRLINCALQICTSSADFWKFIRWNFSSSRFILTFGFAAGHKQMKPHSNLWVNFPKQTTQKFGTSWVMRIISLCDTTFRTIFLDCRTVLPISSFQPPTHCCEALSHSHYLCACLSLFMKASFWQYRSTTDGPSFLGVNGADSHIEWFWQSLHFSVGSNLSTVNIIQNEQWALFPALSTP